MKTIAVYHPEFQQIYLSIDKDRILVKIERNNIISNYHHPNFAKTGTIDENRMNFDTGIKRRIYQMKGNGFDMQKKELDVESPKEAVDKAMELFNFKCDVKLKELTDYQL
jgi:hypothetical protein